MSAQIMPAGPEAYARAGDLLRAGKLVALPTETVYGLAGSAQSDEAIAEIYRVKGRPRHNPLISHVTDSQQADDLALVPELGWTLIDTFWPGPLTLVMPRRQPSPLSDQVSAGLETIALRYPDTDWNRSSYTADWPGPLVMPSANLSGHVSPTTAQHVFDDLGDRIDLIIDGGPCRQGVESTVLRVDAGGATLLRLSEEKRSIMIARATTEQIRIGHIKKPPALSSSNMKSVLMKSY